MEIVKRIEQLIAVSGKSANAVLTECKLSHNSLIAWRSGKAKPSLDAIIKLAKYFGVTTDEIIGDKEQTPELIKKVLLTHLTDDEIKLINNYRKAGAYSRLMARNWLWQMPDIFKEKQGLDLVNKKDLKLNAKQEKLIETIQKGKEAEEQLAKLENLLDN